MSERAVTSRCKLAFVIYGLYGLIWCLFSSGEQQHWAVPPAHIELVQKADPLAKKPYRLFTLQQTTPTANSGDNSDNNDKTTLAKSAGKNYGTNVSELEKQLSQKLS